MLISDWSSDVCSSDLVCGRGARDAEQVYRSNIQIQRRSMGHYRLDPFDWRNEEDRNTFVDILEAFESKFPLPFDGVSLAADGTAWPLHRMGSEERRVGK